MAPIHQTRQFNYIPPPRPPKVHPGIPAVVGRYLSFRAFMELFTGTFCIFILGVLAWKLGKGLRFMTRRNVVGESKSKSPYARYARTWYGWALRERHEAKKDVFRFAYEKYKSCTTWKSTHDDYAWVWWDPGQKGQEAYYESRMPLRWMPKSLRSFEPIPADTIWNSGPPSARVGLSKDNLAGRSVGLETIPSLSDVTRTSESLSVFPGANGRNHRLDQRDSWSRFSSVTLASTGSRASDCNLAQRRKRLARSSQLFLENSQFFWAMNHAGRAQRKSIRRGVPGPGPATQWSASLPCVASAAMRPERRIRDSDTSWGSESSVHRDNRGTSMTRRCSRKYQVWSTCMQVEPSGLIRPKQCGVMGPPGTPKSAFLTSFSSVQLALSRSCLALPQSSDTSRSVSGNHAPSSRGTSYMTASPTVISYPSQDLEGRWRSTPLLCSQTTTLHPAQHVLIRKQGFQSLRSFGLLRTLLQRDVPPKPKQRGADQQKKPSKPQELAVVKRRQNSIPLERLSDGEMRLIDCLDRKLDWLRSELAPGRRPFHFATLANHWLNRRTWVVIDPISRTPINSRRERGDPRFNVPYPTQTWGPKRKYPGATLKRAHTPKINSWRAAINRQRRASGIRDSIKAVELYEGSSADEPPDGMIDPASWMLRKPPQGFAMSTKQQNAYYDGIGGWQETLGDWQKVHRGYRIRKTVHEGRVNRNRVKDLARGITRLHHPPTSTSSAG